MPFDAAYNKPTDWAPDEVVSSVKLNQGQDYTEAVDRHNLGTGPDSTSKVVIASGITQFIFDGTVSSIDIVVSFSTDSDHGNPNFSAAPRIVCSLHRQGSDVGLATTGATIFTRSPNPSGFTLTLSANAEIPDNGKSLSIAWIAIGLT